MLQTCKLAQKILYAILRRMVCNSSGNKQYLKFHFGKIGRFSCVMGDFPDFRDFVAAKRGGGGACRIGMEKLQISATRWRCSIPIHFQIVLINFVLIN